MAIMIWQESKRHNAQKLIDFLMSAQSGDGWPLVWINIIAFAELAASARGSLTQGEIIRILKEMKDRNQASVDDFETIYREFLRTDAVTTGHQVDTWMFFIPFKVTLGSIAGRLPKIRILGKDFKIMTFESVERRLGKRTGAQLRNPAALMANTRLQTVEFPSVFLSVSSQTASWEAAWKQIEPAFDALRGLMEWLLDRYQWRMIFGRDKARRHIPHPTWMIAHNRSLPLQWINFMTSDDEVGVHDLSDNLLQIIRKYASILQNEPNPKTTVALIGDCLRLYAQAMDAHQKHLCFLGFWQLAEAIALAETSGGSTDTVAARIAWHGDNIGLHGSGYTEALTVLGRKRNEIVHRGIHHIEDSDINVLKFACENALQWLFRVQTSLPTTLHVAQYYRIRVMNQAERHAVEDSLALLRKNQR